MISRSTTVFVKRPNPPEGFFRFRVVAPTGLARIADGGGLRHGRLEGDLVVGRSATARAKALRRRDPIIFSCRISAGANDPASRHPAFRDGGQAEVNGEAASISARATRAKAR
jgi:hypothetical protein